MSKEYLEKELKQLAKILPLLIIISGSKVLDFSPNYILDKMNKGHFKLLDEINKIIMYMYVEEHKLNKKGIFGEFADSITYPNFDKYKKAIKAFDKGILEDKEKICANCTSENFEYLAKYPSGEEWKCKDCGEKQTFKGEE